MVRLKKDMRLTVFILLSLLLLFALSHKANSLSPDSLNYMAAAENLANGNGFGKEYVLWPPLYPAILSLHRYVGIEINAYAKNVNFAMYSVLLLTFWILVSRNILSPKVAMAGLVVAACSQPIDFVYDFTWSESIFLPLTLLALLFWARFLSSYRENGGSVMACILLAACLLSRYVGLALVITFLVTLFWFGWHTKNKIHHHVATIGIFCIPLVLWLARNLTLSGELTGSRPFDQTTFFGEIRIFANTTAHWIFPHLYFESTGVWVVSASLFVLVFSVSSCSKCLKTTLHADNLGISEKGLTFVVMTTYIVVYSLSLLPMAHLVPLGVLNSAGARILSPIYLPLVFVLLVAFEYTEQCLKGSGHDKTFQAVKLFAGIWFLVWLSAPNMLNGFLMSVI